MAEIGVDPRGVEIMMDKFQYFIIRIFGINLRQAAIIKQEMLARGAEAAVSWKVCSWNGSDLPTEDSLLISGTFRQIKQFIEKLKLQPFGLPELAFRLQTALDNYRRLHSSPLTINGREYDWHARTHIMGIINVTPDSFSQDGLYRGGDFIEAALRQADQMIAEGADFLDVGAESTRPGAALVNQEEEERRLLPVIKKLAATVNVPIAVDTYKPVVAEKALDLGASIINDIWGLKAPTDSEHHMAKLAAATKAPLIVMHNREKPGYQHLMGQIIGSLAESIDIALAAGVSLNRIIIDPGIGFGKTYQDNLQVLHNLEQLAVLGRPILLGTSRKSVIGLTLDLPVEERLEGTIATVIWGIAKGASIIRVHDVKEVVRAVKMCDAIGHFQ